jgi:hypothetical protein
MTHHHFCSMNNTKDDINRAGTDYPAEALVQYSTDSLITIQANQSPRPITLQKHGPNRSINLLDVKFAALRTDNIDSTHRWRFITT